MSIREYGVAEMEAAAMISTAGGTSVGQTIIDGATSVGQNLARVANAIAGLFS